MPSAGFTIQKSILLSTRPQSNRSFGQKLSQVAGNDIHMKGAKITAEKELFPQNLECTYLYVKVTFVAAKKNPIYYNNKSTKIIN